jgi:hypothetical protein
MAASSACSLRTPVVNAQQYALRDAHRNVAALVPLFGHTPLQHTIFVLEHAPNSLFAQTPHLSDLGDRVVALECEWLLDRALDGLSGI